jgi:hypothetical protein
LTQNRVARQNLGLKVVTRDGDEDLRAVANGAPVRPWNSNRPHSDEFTTFIRRVRENSRQVRPRKDRNNPR